MSLSHGVLQKPDCEGVERSSLFESFAHRTETSKYNLNHLTDEFTLNKNIFFPLLLLKDETARARS